MSTPIFLCGFHSPRKDLLFSHCPNLTQKPCYLVSTVLKCATNMFLGPPDPPKIMNKETELTGRNVTVTWRPSDNNCKIIMYALHYRIVGPAFTEQNWSSVKTNDTTYALQLQYSNKYEIIVSAWNKLGGSNSSEWHLRTAQGKIVLKLA